MAPEIPPTTPEPAPAASKDRKPSWFRDPRIPLVFAWAAVSAAIVGWPQGEDAARSEATAYLIVHEEIPPAFGEGIALEGDAFRRFQRTEAELVTSPDVLNIALAEHPELEDGPLLSRSRDDERVLRESLRVRVPADSNLIAVTMASPDPTEAQMVVEAVVEAALEAAGERAEFIGAELIDAIADEALTLELRTSVARSELKAMAANLGAADPDDLSGRERESLERLRAMIDARDRVHRERVHLETALRSARIHAARSPDQPTSTHRVTRAKLPADRAWAGGAVESLSQLETRVVAAREQEASLDEAIREADLERQEIGDVALNVASARAEIEADEANLRGLRAMIDRIDLESRGLGRLGRVDLRTEVVRADPGSGGLAAALAASTGLGALMYLAFWLGQRNGCPDEA